MPPLWRKWLCVSQKMLRVFLGKAGDISTPSQTPDMEGIPLTRYSRLQPAPGNSQGDQPLWAFLFERAKFR